MTLRTFLELFRALYSLEIINEYLRKLRKFKGNPFKKFF